MNHGNAFRDNANFFKYSRKAGITIRGQNSTTAAQPSNICYNSITSSDRVMANLSRYMSSNISN